MINKRDVKSIVKAIIKEMRDSNKDYYEAMQDSDGEWGVYKPSQHGTMALVKPAKRDATTVRNGAISVL